MSIPITKTVTQKLRHHYSNTELLETGKKLGETHSTYRQLEADKKRVVAEYTSKMSAVKSESQSLSEVINTGYDIRDIECTVTMDFPTRGNKTITRNDTGEEVCAETMTPSENSDSDARRKKEEFDLKNPVLPMDGVIDVDGKEETDEEATAQANEDSNPETGLPGSVLHADNDPSGEPSAKKGKK